MQSQDRKLKIPLNFISNKAQTIMLKQRRDVLIDSQTTHDPSYKQLFLSVEHAHACWIDADNGIYTKTTTD